MALLFLESFDSLRKVKPGVVGVGGGTVGKGTEERRAGPLMRPKMPAQAEAGAQATGSRPRTPQSPDLGRHGVRRILPQCAQRTSPPLTG